MPIPHRFFNWSIILMIMLSPPLARVLFILQIMPGNADMTVLSAPARVVLHTITEYHCREGSKSSINAKLTRQRCMGSASTLVRVILLVFIIFIYTA